jgi:TRAP-type C4-dicarboxylate transport system permease small subunit
MAVVRILRATEDAILVLLLLAMILVASGQILLRNLAGVGLLWADPALRVGVLWATLAGAMVAARGGEHIRIDVLSRFLGSAAERWRQFVTSSFAAAVCALLAWHSGRFVHLEWIDGAILFGTVPAWICELPLPLAFAVMALRYAIGSIAGPDPVKAQ